ncbi:glucose-6-phosphate dehydrogenase, C-terminal domain protein [Mycobacterium xenopi 3993]|nr:glucose-6-phosphate dehydrogenase, C-terminal domain protein [Mycobacterium xenopi 3993]
MRLQLAAQDGNTWRPVHLDSLFAEDLGEPLRPYERLLHAGLVGDHQLFAREDSIEETWRIVQPLLDAPGEVHEYEPGSWARGGAVAAARASQLVRAVDAWDKHARR